MDRSIIQLIQVLQQTESLYSQLLRIIDQEKRAATSADVQQLSAASIEKQGIISALKPLDQQLARIIQQIAVQMQIPRDKLNLSTLAAGVDSPHDRQIRGLNARLQTAIANVRTANEECRQLIRHCLRLVRNKLGYFQHWMGASDVYAASGNIRGEAVGGRFLRGVV